MWKSRLRDFHSPPPSALPRKRQVNAATTHRTPIVTFLSALTQAHRFRYRARNVPPLASDRCVTALHT